MKKFIFALLLIPALASANLNICPRMPIATAVSNQFLTSISPSGATTLAQPSFTNLSGSASAAQMPAFTGDITTSAGAVATTLATVNSNVGSFGSATQVGTFTVNAKGLITAASNTTITATVVTAPPTVQKFTSSSGTYNKNYTFVITSGSATVGATYTNNAVTYTVWATVASATQVVMNGSGAPAASGTLTKASGTGDSTLTFSQVLAPLYLNVIAVGGGGGGSGSGISSSTAGNGGNGGDSTFGSTTATKGSGGTFLGGSGGNGGACTLASGTYGSAITGGSGFSQQYSNSSGAQIAGGSGGANALGGAGAGGSSNGTGVAATANTGAGGGGGGVGGGGSATFAGTGGGAGAYCNYFIPSPTTTYSYAVGSGGTAGVVGNGDHAGGAGAAGYVEVREFYQ